jgi:peptidoglycan/xylan/chitin deacetylase (PgdA/CDA1 family)
VRLHPELTQRIRDQGHQLANHSLHHYWWNNFLVGLRLRGELAGAQAAIATAAGVTPAWHRPPMGQTSPHLAPELHRLGLRCAAWDLRSHDRLLRPRRVLDRLRFRLRPGSVILLHDGGARAEELLYVVAGLLDELAARGLRPVTLAELLGAPAYQQSAPTAAP